MAYTVADGNVFWLGKRIKGVTAQDFTILKNDNLAITTDAVLMKGKVAPASVDGFRLLSQTYATDQTTVFQIMDTKLKPLPGIDAATFKAVGDSYGHDANSAWFEAKPVKKANPARLRALNEFYATDGEKLFKEHNLIIPSEGVYPVDLTTAQMTVHSGLSYENDFFIWDRAGAFYVQAYSWPSIWIPIEISDPDKFYFLDSPATLDGSSVWASDGQRVFWYGQVLPNAQPDDIQLLSDTVAIASGQIFLGSTPEPGIDAASLIPIDNHHRYADKSAIWNLYGGRRLDGQIHIDRDLLASRIPLRQDPEEALLSFYLPAFARLFALFDAIDRDPHNQNLPTVDPDNSVLDGLSGIRSDAQFTISLGTASVTGQPSDWYRMACSLWAQTRGKPSELLHFPWLSTTGTGLQDTITFFLGGPQMLAAQAWAQLGHPEEAQHLAAQALVPTFGRGSSSLERLDAETIAQVDVDLLRNSCHPLFYGQIRKSTYLAAARKTLEIYGLTNPDFRTRWGAITFLHYMTVDTSQDEHFLTDIMPAVLAMLDTEKLGFIRDHALCVLDAAVNSFSRQQALCAPILERLITERVNVQMNTARRNRKA